MFQFTVYSFQCDSIFRYLNPCQTQVSAGICRDHHPARIASALRRIKVNRLLRQRTGPGDNLHIHGYLLRQDIARVPFHHHAHRSQVLTYTNSIIIIGQFKFNVRNA